MMTAGDGNHESGNGEDDTTVEKSNGIPRLAPIPRETALEDEPGSNQAEPKEVGGTDTHEPTTGGDLLGIMRSVIKYWRHRGHSDMLTK